MLLLVARLHFFSYGYSIPSYECMQFTYQFCCWWTFRTCVGLDFGTQHCYKYSDTCALVIYLSFSQIRGYRYLQLR